MHPTGPIPQEQKGREKSKLIKQNNPKQFKKDKYIDFKGAKFDSDED